MNYELCAQIVM